MKKRTYEGFTVLEFLIVIAIMAILVGLILVGLNSARLNARDQQKIANVQRVVIGIQQYQDICREYPANLDDQQTCPELTLQNKTFANLVPDIMNFRFNQGGDYHYVGIASDSQNVETCSGFHLWVQLEKDNSTTNAARYNSIGSQVCTGSSGQLKDTSIDRMIYDIHK